MKKQLFILISILFYGCQEQPKIPISNTLEIALGNKYSTYVCKLNKAFKKDTTALLDFFKINYINDGAGYDHGFILFQLMKVYGDREFSNTLQKTTESELSDLRQYFEVGIDANDKYKDEMKKEYPNSSDILQIE